MEVTLKTQLSSFGFLRLGLIGLSILSILLPVFEWVVIQFLGEIAERSALGLSAQLIAPVMAPVLIIVILFDIFMAKVRTSDDPMGIGVLYKTISQIETILIVVMMAFWVPFFIYFI
ncbi:MAG: hypothetical protein ACJA0I_001386 [Gammaproteobacteria bacterium]|jgi:hypothetical protein